MAAGQQTAPPRSRRKGGRRRQPVSGWMVVMVVAIAALFVGAVYVLSGGGGAPATSTPAKVQGSLKIDPGEINAGDQRLGGQPVNASFTLTNVGDKTLTITEKPYVENVKGC